MGVSSIQYLLIQIYLFYLYCMYCFPVPEKINRLAGKIAILHKSVHAHPVMRLSLVYTCFREFQAD